MQAITLHWFATQMQSMTEAYFLQKNLPDFERAKFRLLLLPWISKFYLSKFIFIGSPLLWFVLVCKTPEFWRWKLWDQNFVPFDSGMIHIKENKKPNSAFFIDLRIKFVWSHGLQLLKKGLYWNNEELISTFKNLQPSKLGKIHIDFFSFWLILTNVSSDIKRVIKIKAASIWI